MKTFCISTPTIISILDIMTMGDSSKREDDSKIGKYDSGLKYAIALLLRNNVDITISTTEDDPEHGKEFRFSTKIQGCETTKKEKNLIVISEEDMKSGQTKEYVTGFAANLGHDWGLWMAFRELISNMIDEKGHYYEKSIKLEPNSTYIDLKYDEGSNFDSIIRNKHLYYLQSDPLVILPDGYNNDYVEIHPNPEGYTRLYKQGILIYSNLDKPSKYIYNTSFGDINEMRILKSEYHHLSQIYESFFHNCLDKGFYETYLLSSNQSDWKSDDIMNSINGYQSCRDELLDAATRVYQEKGFVYGFDPIMKAINLRKDSILPGRMIESLNDHIWAHNKSVVINSELTIMPKTEVLDTIELKIQKMYNFNVDCCIKYGDIANSKVIADKHNNCLILSEDFDLDTDFPVFIIQYIDLTRKGNIITNLATYITEILKK